MKQAVAMLLAIVAWGLGAARAEEGVPHAFDLRKDAQAAREKNGVVLDLGGHEFLMRRWPRCA